MFLYTGLSCVLLVCVCGCAGLGISDLYLYGEYYRDETLPVEDDVSSSPVRLRVPITFYGQQYSTVYVNSNGHVSFETEIPTYQSNFLLPIMHKVIAPFLADVDTRLSGNIYYRETSDPSLLEQASNKVTEEFSHHGPFMAQSLFIVTWDDVGYYREQYDQTNTFQLVVASDGYESYAMFLYPDTGINWIQGQGKQAPATEDIPAQAGFDNGNGYQYYTVQGSGTSEIFNLNRYFNNRYQIPGLWLFRIGRVQQDIETPDAPQQPDSGGDSQGPAPTSCNDGGSRTCSQYATCQDGYRGGYCCVCQQGYYGNGVHCVEADEAQRISGLLSGTLNNIPLNDLNLYVYVMTNEGKAFTAISQMDGDLADSIKTLYSLGGVMAWLFAGTTTAQAVNGYTLTGGVFNRTATVTYQTGETVDIRETFTSQDGVEYMKVKVVVNGNVPYVRAGADVEALDGTQEYTRVRQGHLRSFSTQRYTVDGVEQSFTVEQNIQYTECSGQLYESLGSMTLTLSNIMLLYNDDIARYVITGNIAETNAISDNPCLEGARTCDTNADCVVIGGGYSCECHVGYTGNGESCRDVDECSEGYSACHQFADCYNTEGSYQCTCMDGYQGDGQTCERDMSCGFVTCDSNAQCLYDSSSAGYYCQCDAGYHGDGETCYPQTEFSCIEVNNCHPNADCVYDYYSSGYKCECNDGFSGDGFSCTDGGGSEQPDCNNCDPYASCQYDPSIFSYRCMCSQGYSGDGYRCFPIVETCDIAYNCDINAQCLYDDVTSGYVCRCNPGYSGDGYICESENCQVADICDMNARCEYDDYSGGYACVCNTGYTGDGRSCVMERACNDDPSICHQYAGCQFDVSQYTYVCVCQEGYQGDGYYCVRDAGPEPTPEPEPPSDRDCYDRPDLCVDHADCGYDYDTNSYACMCAPGYTGDGYSLCSQDCRYNSDICDINAHCMEESGGVYMCMCNHGYHGDGYRCTELGTESSYLMYCQGLSVMKIPFNPTDENPGDQIIMNERQTAVGIDVDCFSREFYWTDVSQRLISKARLDGSEEEVIMRGVGSPEGIALDWIAKNMYWTDSESRTIEVSRMDGTDHKVLFDEDIKNPRAIVVDPISGLLFWSDWNRKAPKIERANMDGSERRVLLSEDLGLPNALTIDFEYQQLCWADAGTQHIECVSYDGRGRRVVYNLAAYPFGLVYAERMFYWTDWNMNSLPSIDRYGSEVSEPMPLPAGGNGKLYGIAAVRDQCPAGSNACALNNGGCQYLCLPTPNRGRTCVCPDDVTEEQCQGGQ